MKIIKKISLFLLLIPIFQINLNAAEIGSKHEYGLSFLGSYEYEEPKLMHLRSGSQATDDELENLGFLYNYKNAFINDGGLLNEFEFDSSYQFLTQTYWSNGTGTMKDIDTEIYNLRALYGIQLSDKLMLKSGLGYRHLYHFWQNRISTTGHYGYDREQDYTYIPIIAELKMPIPELNLDGKLNIEFDQIIEGNNTSYLGYLGGSYKDLEFKNSDGYAWKVSYEGKRNGFTFEPYYEFMHVDDSNTVSSSLEPANTTKEVGLRVKKEFNSNRSVATDYKEVLGNDDFYFGVQLLRSEVETGASAPTGTTKIEDEDYGYSIVSGMQVLDGINDKPIKLDVELAYNQFGQSSIGCNNGDTFVVDGRFRGGNWASGTTLTCNTDGYNTVIESYSTSLGLKPSLDLSNGLSLNGIFGYHRWNQIETEAYVGTRASSTSYDDIDTYMGIGFSLNQGNLNLGLDYLEHNMYYDAETISASLKYNF